ncbi:ABC transporter [Longispora fulva]|uniref:Peptide/nickel transport system substrate-binding protein n=1 Tax=Longispora fulva TaxID=619741 RepID=A0A8J7GH08_9ACTN|nr:ABC transporter substrate-binding protein [Longispora fulva]MBG6138864.1 peptide/nickel transport system substrate-binding protein [Longispora fulva]GIG58357.1 ABC transporter [Longispora fulva]
MRHRVRVLTISALAIGLAAAGCSKTGNGKGEEAAKDQKQSISIDYKGTTPVPAPEVKDARKGGQVLWLADGNFEHLDPGQEYVGDALSFSTNLFHRTLTGYIEPTEEGGTLKVVGDLAVNAGETTDGGKTWKYTLRDGLKYEDGSPIKSADIKHGVARAMGKYGEQGPQYIQNALDPDRKYKGPDEKGDGDVPGITTPDDKTIIFTMKDPHPEFPELAVFPTTTPVPAAKDTKDKYETEWISSGPYKRKEYKIDNYLILERNPNWDPKTDPIRHQYVDTIKADFTPNRATQTQRLIASQGEDATATMTSNVAQENIATVAADPELTKRVLSGRTPYDNYININTTKVTDVDVRKALIYLYDKDAAIKNAGGSKVAIASTTITAPNVPGYKDYDVYKAGPNGDVAKAKALLAGKTVPKLSYCFANTANGQKAAAIVKTSLERENLIQIALNPIDRKDYYTTIGKKGTTCDLMASGWGADYPDNQSTLGVLMDGSQIKDNGNQNYSYFDNAEVNKKLKELALEPDRAKAAKAYGDLDQEIMEKYAPLIPTVYTRAYTLVGSKLGGAFLSPNYAQVNLTNVYVKA